MEQRFAGHIDEVSGSTMLHRYIIVWIGILATVTVNKVLAKEDAFVLEIKESCLHGSSFLCPGYYALSAFTRFLHAPHSPIQVRIYN